MLWFSGLRGAMAFALAVQNTVSPARQMFFTTTCLIAIITVVFVGGMTTPVLACLQIPVGICDDEREDLLEGDSLLELESGTSSYVPSQPGKRSFMARIWKDFDKKFMKPMLTSSGNIACEKF